MNNANSLRWSCRIVRRWAALSGETASESRLAARHANACPDCARYFGACDAFESELRDEATHQVQFPSAGLDARIIRAVAASARPAPARHRRARYLGTLAGAAAAIVAGLVVWQNGSRITPASTTVNVTTRPAPISASKTSSEAPSLASAAAPVAKFLKQDPLQTEVDSVYADARSAVRFLALNFLPGGAVAQTDSPNSSATTDPNLKS